MLMFWLSSQYHFHIFRYRRKSSPKALVWSPTYQADSWTDSRNALQLHESITVEHSFLNKDVRNCNILHDVLCQIANV